MKYLPTVLTLGLALAAVQAGCGARTGLPDDDDGGPRLVGAGEPAGASGVGSTGGAGGAGQGGAGQGGAGQSGAGQGGAGHSGAGQGGAGQGGAGQSGAGQGGAGQGGAGIGGAGSAGAPACVDGETQSCGSDVGACKPGTRVCTSGAFGECMSAIGPGPEVCNGIDDDCDGQIDDGFGLGLPCQGTGTNQCFDGVTTCNGCVKTGPEKVEICNGVDDNCNGQIDADCEVGDCQPTLLVTGSTPSSPSCVDFPVQAGSQGTLNYPCGGGPVTATLGLVPFTGSVSNNFVSLDGEVIIPPDQSPDGCTWLTSHHIEGVIPSGVVDYSYAETLIGGVNCWSPCTEIGTVQIIWTANP